MALVVTGSVHGEKTLNNKPIGDAIHIRIVSPILLVYQCIVGLIAMLKRLQVV